VLSAAWTAGTTRAQLLLERRVGPEQARAIAGCASLTDGLGMLAGSAYGERVGTADELARAQRRVAETLLWHLRIAAGWLPAAGAALVRTLAARFELENVDARLAALGGAGHEETPFELGGLATAWEQIDRARTVEEIAATLSDSGWRLPAASSAAEVALGLRVAWARRVWDSAPQAADWVAGAAALLVARELLVAASRAHVAQLQRLPGIGAHWSDATTLADLRAALPPRAAWVLADVGDPSGLWAAELAWWHRVERDAETMRRSREPRAAVLAAVALLACDAERAARALAVAAAHPGGLEGWEGLDGAL